MLITSCDVSPNAGYVTTQKHINIALTSETNEEGGRKDENAPTPILSSKICVGHAVSHLTFELLHFRTP